MKSLRSGSRRAVKRSRFFRDGGMSSRRAQRSAITLVELLVAMTATLILMVAVITAFSMANSSINDNRATMEVTDRLRSAVQRLMLDLQGSTAPTLPLLKPEMGAGYFEYFEGPNRDSAYYGPLAAQVTGSYDSNAVTVLKNEGQDFSQLGDADDYVAFTTRSAGDPYVTTDAARPSQVAEVLWACVLDQNSVQRKNPTYTLYRKIRPIRTDATTSNVTTASSLADLTKRENRLYHKPGSFPWAIDLTANQADLASPQNVVLTNVVGFDIKAWDPRAPVFTTGGKTLAPSDADYKPDAPNPTAFGAYVDLSYAVTASVSNMSNFSNMPRNIYPANTKVYNVSLWDTWPAHPEYDTTSSDGIKNGNEVGVDDVTGKVNYPPYPYPLRGIQIKIRVYEPDTRQVREVTVTEQFLPD